MKFKFWKSDKPVLVMTLLLLLLVAAVPPVVHWNASLSRQWVDQLQQLEVQRLRLVNALNILKDHGPVVQAVNHSAKSNVEFGAVSIDSIALSLIEAIKLQARTEQLELTQLTVIQSDVPPMASETNESDFHALRVKFALTTDKAVSLLSLFDALKNAAGWRPIEVRECSVVRLTDLPVSLHADCSVDIYYFPGVGT